MANNVTAPKTATLTNLNPSVDLVNTRGSVEIAGDFTGPATVSQSLTGGSTTVATFTTDSTFFTQANQLTFGLAGGNGPITIKWYSEVTSTDGVRDRILTREE